MFLKLTCVVALAFVASANPVLRSPADSAEQNKLMEAGFFEGDMVLPGGRNALVGNSNRWTSNVVYYEISGVFNADEKNVIIGGLNEIEATSCLRFVQRTNQKNFVMVTGELAGCYSYIGMIGGQQILNLQRYDPIIKAHCVHHATVIHEFLHALGIYHQQSATNRDDYVTIQWSNVQAGQEHNFNKYSASVVTDFGIAYDYESIMHYDSTGFSKNGEPTIVTNDPRYQDVIGRSPGLSSKDIAKIRAMYNC